MVYNFITEVDYDITILFLGECKRPRQGTHIDVCQLPDLPPEGWML